VITLERLRAHKLAVRRPYWEGLPRFIHGHLASLGEVRASLVITLERLRAHTLAVRQPYWAWVSQCVLMRVTCGMCIFK
jgi:hypothetical protein